MANETGRTDADAEARLIQLYTLAVEMAQRLSAQRGAANAFYLTVQTALASVLGLSTGTLQDMKWWVAVAICLIGVLLSASWWFQLRSYRELTRAKFAVIHDLEKRLPVAVFTDEWKVLRGGDGHRYISLGVVERTVPVAFAVLYLVIALGGVL
ncbi:RipA family octameric membrane protein [Streptomyces litchfieldiae]|uniref:Small integral membrane protein n=1 Tax=Streptomyces litchfieldiae TaxID=3075543 RepID=A0ABU2N1Q0_9ACTN|nr:hypothetical protein [Streptomyces sp. DSM 44938]MDT0347219.1 hypothetical protein [Streptomyces sp. DSM 44938]